uniref:Nucleosome assembly protein n=1 Tax=Alexandrium catenella TaxID=2925 RepID=A0A7S1R9E1_ALECA
MGKKKAPADKPEEAEEPAKEEKKEEKEKEEEKKEEDDDPPIVKELKVVDDKYLEVEREYEKELNAIENKYDGLRVPLLQERLKVLTEGEDKSTGTPGLKGFWLKAIKNLPALEEQIMDWDEPVLEYLRDITRENLDLEDQQKGFKLTLHFIENPYFENEVLWKEYHTEQQSPYTGDMTTKEVKCSEIDWKTGKNVTVEAVKKKVKGGGAKKQKQKNKETLEPRESFFRSFFRQLKLGDPVPDDVHLDGRGDDEDSDEDDEQMMDMLLEYDYDAGSSIKDLLIPFAVRWYTGEARPDDDDDDDEDDEEEDDDDYEDDEDESEDEPAPKKKPQPKKKGGGDDKKKGSGASSEEQPKPEECKQQ